MRRIAPISLLLASSVFAAPTNEQFFQSVRENIDKPVDSTRFVAVLLVVIGVVLLLALFGRKKEERAARPKVLNHPGKLLKEVVSAVHLKPAELKQLKLLAEGQNVSSPLTLLLCPSVFAKAVRAKTSKVDRRVLAQLAKKLVQPAEPPPSTHP
jgi:hypothetical protein